jgi:dihydrofolate reductase
MEQAATAAGDKKISIAGGANIVQQCVKSGILDELQLHIVPILMGGGVRLFDNLGDGPIPLPKPDVVDSPKVTDLTYRLRN